jgi:hypothetical protein
VPAVSSEGATEAAAPSWRDAAIWIALAAVPSGLLVAVTAHISTDIAAVPLLWVIPLALYLLTFVIVFSRKPIVPHWLVVLIQPIGVVGLIVVILFNLFENFPLDPMLWTIASHVLVFFVCALMCHGELARRRPPARYLTSFYLWMSFGGMVGGILTALVAPLVFRWVAEYPILIALTVLCRWSVALPEIRAERYIRYAVLAGAVLIIVFWNVFIGPLLALTALVWRRPLPFALIVAILLLTGPTINQLRGNNIFVRSFFGVHKISDTADGRFRLLTHGTTVHGVQPLRDANEKPVVGRPRPAGYYYEGAPMAQAVAAIQASSQRPVRFGFIGLGSGSLACLARSTDFVRYYEIDPTVAAIARNPNYFTFIAACRPDVEVVLGDARLTLQDAPEADYDLIVVDAFSSDAIPIHLLTREAMAIYLKKLAPRGIVVMHVSNRHLELASVVANLARSHGLVSRVNYGEEFKNDAELRYSGTVVAVARADEHFGSLTKSKYWELQEPDDRQWIWTDDYSNIVGAFLRGMQK